MINRIFFAYYLSCLILISKLLCCSCDNNEVAQLSPAASNDLYVPHAPYVQCNFLPLEFIDCEEPVDHKGNRTAKDAAHGHGCVKFGGSKYIDVEKTKVWCVVLPDIECSGPLRFARTVPCIKYRGHYFVTTLIYSILLGFLGMDRFGLAQTGTAVGKLLTLGGVGVWWLVDIVLLVSGSLLPEDSSNWNPYV